MNWLVSTFIALFGSAAYVSFLKLAQGYYDPKTVQSFLMTICFLYYYTVGSNKNLFKSFEIYAVIAGLLFGLMTISFNAAVNLANNPGLPGSIVPSNALLTYFISLPLFGLAFSWKKFSTILLIIVGCIITTIPNMKDFKSSNNLWIVMTLIAATCAAGNDLFSKLSLNKINNNQYLVIQMFTAAITTIVAQYMITKTIGLKTLKKKDQKKDSKIVFLNKYPQISLFVALSGLLVFRQFLGIAIEKSENPSYPRAIFNSQFFVSLLLSMGIQKGSQITSYQWAGSSVVLAGVLAMALQK
jgi:drug/metabolite transporter (DMT)-like permease